MQAVYLVLAAILAGNAHADVNLKDGESVIIGSDRVSCGGGRQYLPSECRDAFTGVEANFRRCVADARENVAKENCRWQALEPFFQEHGECVSVVGSQCYDLCLSLTPFGDGPKVWCKLYCKIN